MNVKGFYFENMVFGVKGIGIFYIFVLFLSDCLGMNVI